MYAFYKSEDGKLYKAYENSGDWQIVCSDGKERWFSIWSKDITGSLVNAFSRASGVELNIGSINIVQQ